MTRILWSPQALLDLESIRDYIARDSARYAELVIRRLVAAVERLEAFPQSGRIVPERNTEDIREIIVKPYRIVYRVLLLKLHKTRRIQSGYARMPTPSSSPPQVGQSILVRIMSRASGYWNAEWITDR